MVYGKSDSNTWNNPLMDSIKTLLRTYLQRILRMRVLILRQKILILLPQMTLFHSYLRIWISYRKTSMIPSTHQ